MGGQWQESSPLNQYAVAIYKAEDGWAVKPNWTDTVYIYPSLGMAVRKLRALLLDEVVGPNEEAEDENTPKG